MMSRLLPRASAATPLAALLVLLGGLVVGCSTAAGPRRIDLSLTVASKESLTRPQMERADGRFVPIRYDADGRHCRGSGGFADFRADTPVEVLDQRGRRLGLATLGPGVFQREGHDPDGEPLHVACRFALTMPLTDQARIYVLRIAGERYVKRFHVSELRGQGGRIHLRMD